MEYQLSWIATGLVVVLSLVIGIASAFVFRDGAPRALWALLVALVFVVAGCASVLFEYSWMSTANGRFIAQALAIGAMLTGLTFAMRDKA
jgi:hypothetical protein